LLDDGFQHRSLARDFDIVLVTPEDTRDRLLPDGRLREPPNSLARADAIVLTSGASGDSFPLDGKLVWRARRGILPKDVPLRPVAFCGIARPKNFLLQLRTAGIEPVAEAFYRDHHAYTERLIKIVESFPKITITVVGDLVADEFIFGEISRVSREAPVLILKHRERTVLPGGGANAIYNLADLRANVLPVGVVGEDEPGRLLLKGFRHKHIPVSGILKDKSYTTVTKTRILAGMAH